MVKNPESSAKQITSLEGNFSAAVRANATQQEKKQPIEPFGRTRPSKKEALWAHLPQGDWLVDGVLNPEFWDWLATSWMRKHGTPTIHEARANVNSNFYKNPGQVILQWEVYSIEKLGKEAFTPLPDAVRDWQHIQHLLVWEQYNSCKDLEHFYSLRSWNRAYLEYAVKHLPNFDWSKHLTAVSA